MFNSRMDRLGQANMLMHIHAILLLKRIWPPSPLDPSHAAAPSKALWETLEWKSWQQLENKIAEAHKLCVCGVGVGELGQSEIPEVTECDGKLGVK